MSFESQGLAICIGLFVFLLLCLEVGFRSGLRASKLEDGQGAGQVGAIQGAILGLLGLLLAFSFSAAASRFLERQDLIVQEANAIGTAFLRADLIEEPHRSELRGLFKKYTDHLIEVSERLAFGLQSSDLQQVEVMHHLMWQTAIAGVASRPVVSLAVLAPLNDVIDIHSTRLAAGRKHLPMPVLGLLMAASGLALGVIGYGSGLGKKRRMVMTLSLVAIIGMALWITLDLDHPRVGLLQLSDAPLKALKLDVPRGE